MLAAFLIAMPMAVLASSFECLIEPSQVVEIRASVDGVIAVVKARRGELLRKGQVLVELESDAERVAVESAGYRARMEGQLATARTRVDYATTKLNRVLDLERKQYLAQQARDDAKAELHLAENELQAALESRELAKIEFRRAQEQLALRTLASPFDGVVVDRMLNPGDLAEPGNGRKAVLKIAQINPLKVDVVMPAALFGQVKAAQRANVVTAVGGKQYAASVDIVDRVIDAASGTFVVRLGLPNPDMTVPIGSRCTAEFDDISITGQP